MPVIEQKQTVPAGFDAAVFLKLANDPQAYQAQLNELNAAAAAARAEQEKARTAYELVGAAEQISELLAKAKEEKDLAAQTLAQASSKAAQLIADAQQQIKQDQQEFDAKVNTVQEVWLTKGKEIDERAAAVSLKESEFEALRNATLQAKEGAQYAQETAQQAQKLAEKAQLVAQERLDLINNKFVEFIKAIA